MKKNNLIRMLIFGMIFMLFGCSEDLYEEKNQNETLKVSHKKFEDLIQQTKFCNAINKVQQAKNNSNAAKTIMEEQYGFTISNKPVNVIENDSVTSYTLFVTRDSSAVNCIENLIVQVNKQNITSAYLLKYTSNTNLPLDSDMKNFEGTKTVFPIIYNANQSGTTNKEVYESCNVTRSWYCYGPMGHTRDCQMGYPIYETVCEINDGSGGNSGSTNTNSGEILTAPHGGGGGGSQTFQDTPCETLNEAIQDLKVNQAIQNLKTKTVTKKETAYNITRKFDLNTDSNVYNAIKIEGDAFTAVVQTGGFTKGNAHNHPIDGQSIPSIQDVSWLNSCQTNISPVSSVGYNIIVCPNPVSPNNPLTTITYAITVDNLATLNTQINNIYGTNFDNLTPEKQKLKNDRINDSYAEKFKNVQNSTSGMEEKFLNLFANFGISLHKFDNATNNWNKLNLTNNIVTPQPCQ